MKFKPVNEYLGFAGWVAGGMSLVLAVLAAIIILKFGISTSDAMLMGVGVGALIMLTFIDVQDYLKLRKVAKAGEAA